MLIAYKSNDHVFHTFATISKAVHHQRAHSVSESAGGARGERKRRGGSVVLPTGVQDIIAAVGGVWRLAVLSGRRANNIPRTAVPPTVC